MTLFLLALTLTAGLLTACGGKTDDTGAAGTDVDLEALYNGWAETYDWTEDAQSGGENSLLLMNVEGETLEGYYPGLSELASKQLVAKAPMMSSVVNETVLVQCETEADAAKAAAILQDRADAQAQGGAWYPGSMEAWGRATVLQQGTYVALIASSEHQEDLETSFNEQFA
jgi:rhodanese-related sulfurtransferase